MPALIADLSANWRECLSLFGLGLLLGMLGGAAILAVNSLGML